MATELAKKGIETVLIPDSAALAVMEKVSKIIISTSAGLLMSDTVLLSCISSKLPLTVDFSQIPELMLLLQLLKIDQFHLLYSLAAINCFILILVPSSFHCTSLLNSIFLDASSTPFYPTPDQPFNEFLSPSETIDAQLAVEIAEPIVLTPRFDYVPPNYVSVIITDNGAFVHLFF